jgi:secreted Zn-dependent insulinase-like peptidase
MPHKEQQKEFASEMQKRALDVQFIKQECDKCSYKAIELPNGLVALLVHQPDLDKVGIFNSSQVQP